MRKNSFYIMRIVLSALLTASLFGCRPEYVIPKEDPIKEMGRSSFDFMGETYISKGGCGTWGALSLDNSPFVVSLVNTPVSGTVPVTGDYYLGNLEVVAIQISDQDGKVYVAIDGSLTVVERDQAAFSVTVQEITPFLKGTFENRTQLLGRIGCDD